jgi:hypothetical protein
VSAVADGNGCTGIEAKQSGRVRGEAVHGQFSLPSFIWPATFSAYKRDFDGIYGLLQAKRAVAQRPAIDN